MRGQGTFEYLIVLAAILALAIVVVVAANSLFPSSPSTAEINVSVDGVRCDASFSYGGWSAMCRNGTSACTYKKFDGDWFLMNCYPQVDMAEVLE